MGLSKKLLAVLAMVSLLLGLALPAFAAYPDDVPAAAARMQALGLVQGRDGGDLALDSTITRAELMTIVVRAFGKENDAKLLAGAPAFPDSASHWASGYIAMAKNLIEANGFGIGMPDGTFNPNGQVTTGEAIAFASKFLGVPRDASQAWPNDYLSGAVTAGLVSQADADSVKANLSTAATRGLVFYLFDNAFYNFKLADGKTVYTKYVKPVGPSLNVDDVAATTTDPSVTITGSVSSDANGVWVNSQSNAATVTSGKFSGTVELAMGENSISVGASDVAGNVVTKTVTVTRSTGTATTIEASDITVNAGEAVDVTVAVKDDKGNAIADAPVAITSDLGTFDATTGKFTAGTTAGTGTATVTSGDLTATVNVTVNAGNISAVVITPATVSLGLGAAQQFTAVAQDANGNPVDATIVWSSTGGVIDQAGNFAGTTAGNATVTASVGDVSGTATATIFGNASKIAIAKAGDIVRNSNSETTVTATAEDALGNPVPSYTGTITFAASNGSGVLSATTVTATAGVAQVTLTSNDTSSSDNITVVVTASATNLTGSTVNVTAAKQVLTTISATPASPTLANDGVSTTAITYKQLDQEGETMGIARGVTLDLTNSASSIATLASDTVTMASTTATATLQSVANASGAVTVSGKVSSPSTLTGVAVSDAVITVSSIGFPASLSVDSLGDKTANVTTSSVTSDDKTQVVVVRVKDANGNQITNPTINDQVIISITADSDEDTAVNTMTSGYTTRTNNTANTTAAAVPKGGVVKFNSTNITAETVTYTVKANWCPLSITPGVNACTGSTASSLINLGTQTVTGNFVAGPAEGITVTAAPKGHLTGGAVDANMFLNANGGSTGTFTIDVVDQQGNDVTAGSYKVAVTKDADANVTTDLDVNGTSVMTTDGEATFAITSTTTTGGPDTYTFQLKKASDNTINLGSPVSLNVYSTIMGVPTQVIADTALSGQAGEDTSIYAYVEDTNSQRVTTDTTRNLTLSVRKIDTKEVVSTLNATTSGGRAKFVLNLTTTNAQTGDAAGYQYKVTADGLTNANSGDGWVTYSVAPDVPASLSLTSDVSTLAADGSSRATLTAALLDKYGNKTWDAANNTTVTIKADTSSYGNFSGAPAIGTGVTVTVPTASTTAAAKVAAPAFIANSSPGTVNFTATATGTELTSATASVSSVFGGFSATKLRVEAAADQTAGKYRKVLVTVLDNNDFRVTNSTLNITLSADSDSADISLASTAVYDSDAATYTTSTSAAAVNGQATFYVADAVAETVTLTAETGSLTDGTGTVNFTPGTADHVGISFSPTSILGNGSSTTTATVKVLDANANPTTNFKGNTVTSTSGSAEFTFDNNWSAANTSSYAVLSGRTATLSAGVATVQIQSKSVVLASPQAQPVYARVKLDGETSYLGSPASANVTIVDPNATTASVAWATPAVYNAAGTTPQTAFVNADTPSITLKGTGSVGGALTVERSVNGGAYSAVATGVVDGSGNFAVVAPLGYDSSVAAGTVVTNTFKVDIVDLMGHSKSTSDNGGATQSATYQPTVSFTSGTNSPSTTYSVTGNAPKGATVTFSNTANGSTSNYVVNVDASSTTWSQSITIDAVNPNALKWVSVYDANGNAISTAIGTQLTVNKSTQSLTIDAIGTTTNATIPAVTGLGNPGDTVTVTLNSNAIGTTTVAGTGAWSLTGPFALSYGANAISANSGAATSTVTRKPGALTFVTPAADGFQAGTTVTLKFSGAIVGATLVVTDGPADTMFVVAALNGDGSYDVNNYGLTGPASANTLNTLTAYQYVNGVQSDVTTRLITVDAANPVVTITAPANSATIAGASVSVTATATDTNGSGVSQWRLLVDGTPGTWQTGAISSTVDATALAAAGHTVGFDVKDAVGNVGTATVNVTVNNTTPAVGTLTATATQNHNVTVTGTSNVLSGTWSGTLTDSAAHSVAVSGTTDGTGAFTVTQDTAGTTLVDGVITASISVKNAANVTSAAKTTTFTLDTLAPVAPAIPGGQVFTQATSFSLSGSGETGAEVWMNVNNAGFVDSTVSVTAGAFTVPVTLNADGSNTVAVELKDAAGNTSTATAAMTIVQDNTNPLPTLGHLTTGGSNDIVNSSASVAVTGNAGDTNYQSLTLKVKASATDVEQAGVLSAISVDATTKAITATLNTSGLADGNYYIEATVTDKAGRVGTATRNFTVDKTAPTSGLGAIATAQKGTVAVTGTSDTNGAAWTMTLTDAGSVHTVTKTGTVDTSAGNPISASIATTTTDALNDGTITVNLTVKDSANNTSTVATITFTLDNTAPTASIVKLSATTIKVTYTESNLTGATTAANYVSSDGPTPANSVVADGTNPNVFYVSWTVAPAGLSTVTISGVSDTASTALSNGGTALAAF